MSTKRSKTRQIQIPVVKEQIDLGENHACAVNLDSRIEWKCDHPFAVQFDWDAPFEVSSRGEKSLTMRFKAGAAIKPNHPYRHTIAVLFRGQVITTIAIIIVKPPPPPPWERPHWRLGQEPGTLFVGGRRR